jgi:hypothetical protein
MLSDLRLQDIEAIANVYMVNPIKEYKYPIMLGLKISNIHRTEKSLRQQNLIEELIFDL